MFNIIAGKFFDAESFPFYAHAKFFTDYARERDIDIHICLIGFGRNVFSRSWNEFDEFARFAQYIHGKDVKNWFFSNKNSCIIFLIKKKKPVFFIIF